MKAGRMKAAGSILSPIHPSSFILPTFRPSDGLEGLADDLGAAIARKEAEAMEMALQVYYAAEELSRDPEHADLIPHVERMRDAYRSSYGRPIPLKPR
jgi:hypothetical protein